MYLLLFTACGLAADPAPPSGCHTHERAGHPRCVAWWAVPSWSCGKECGGLVGGGCLRKGTGAGPYDGTWGWDYVGCMLKPNRVFLGWCANCVRQPKPGTYKVDGPHVPDVFAVKPIKRAIEKRQHPDED